MIAFSIIAWLLLLTSAAFLTYWTIVSGRVLRLLRDRPSVRAGLDLPAPAGGWPRLSIIIPAHNEERVIDACAVSLRAVDYPNLEIIFVLDRCTDRTAEIVRRHAEADPRVRVIDNAHCPDDWAGKCHAARVGAEEASGDYLLFSDADTQFHRDLPRAAVALAAAKDIALLSLLTSLTYERRFERIAQPVASINLIRMYPFKPLDSAEHPRPFANGQFMLFTRRMYERLGGHAAVKDDLLEDLAFARRVHEHGGRCITVLAEDMLRVSMYDSLADFRRGWKRIFIEACRRRPKRLRLLALRVFTLGIIGPTVQIMTVVLSAILLAMDPARVPGIDLSAIAGFLPGDAMTTVAAMVVVVLLAWLIQAVTLGLVYRACGAPPGAIIWYPAGCWIVAGTMREAARDLERGVPIRWAGREYVLKPVTG